MILSGLLVGSPATAADKVVPLKKDEPAPFAGMLYPAENAIRITQKAERCAFVVSETEQRAERLVSFEKQLCGQQRAVDKKAHDRQLEVLEDRPADMRPIIIGYVIGVLTMIAAAYAHQELTP